MRTILGYIIIYFSIILGSTYISIKFNKKIETCIIIDILLRMIALYIFGILNLLLIGVVLINLIPIIFGIIILIKNIKNEKIKENILTYGLYFFSILYFVFIIFTYNKMSVMWDEYSYWAVVSKSMFYSDKMICDFISYPPFPTILQYFFCKTIGIYNQGIELFTNYILGFALLIPLFEKITSNKKLPNICLSIIIICIPTIFNLIFYEAIYVDAILGMLIGYILYQIYQEKNKKFLILSIITSFFVLTLMKATGFYIALILIGIFTLILFIEKIYRKIQLKEYINKNKDKIIFLFIILCMCIVLYVSWNLCIKNVEKEVFDTEIYKEENGIEKQIDKRPTILEGIGTIVTTIFGSNEKNADYDISNRNLFLDVYTKYAIKRPIPIGIITTSIIFAIISVIIYKFIIKKEEKNRFLYITISIFVGLIVYILFLQLAYITQFSIDENYYHASLERYVSTYLLGILIFIISIMLDYIDKENKNLKYICLTLVVILFSQINIIADATITSGVYSSQIRGWLNPTISSAEKLKENLKKTDRVYLVNQESDMKCSSFEIKYFTLPELRIKITPKFNEKLEKEFENRDILEIWKEILYNKYDYVYIYKTDKYFNDFAISLFDGKTIKEETIYKVIKENKNIKLVEVE